MTKLFTLLFACLASTLITGCASTPSTSVQSNVLDSSGFSSYKRAYVKPIQQDEFQVASAVMGELSTMGMEINAQPFKEPQQTDMIVEIEVIDGWDLSKYLKGLQLRFTNAASSRIIATTAFNSNGIWMGVREKRLKAVFNDLREKLGLPPTKQFD
ncbi:MAG: hypothetical protein Q8L16_23110 [Hydrogenophaga sp.]|nr:hypothetical protein [Hydrogenophaga sp.]